MASGEGAGSFPKAAATHRESREVALALVEVLVAAGQIGLHVELGRVQEGWRDLCSGPAVVLTRLFANMVTLH